MEGEKSVKTIWANDFFQRIISVVLAIVIWLYIIVVQNPEIDKDFNNIPIIVANQEVLKSNGLALMNNKDMKVNIKIRGTRSGIRLVDPAKIIASITIVDLAAGNATLPINIYMPPIGVTVINKEPYSVSINLEKLARTSHTVTAALLGSVKDSYMALDPILSPSEITIKGPESLLSTIAKVSANIDIAGKFEDVNTIEKIHLYDAVGKEIFSTSITLDIESINVEIPILMKKLVPITVNYINENKIKNAEITGKAIEPANIVIAGKKEILDTIDSISIGTVDLYGITNNKTIQLPLLLPKGIICPGKIQTATISITARKK